MPSYPTKKFTPKQLNGLVDDAVRGHYVPLGQAFQFEKALYTLANNPDRTPEDIAHVRDMTKYNWRAAMTRTKESPLVEFSATHVTNMGTPAALIREGVYLVEGALPISDIEARHRGITFTPVADRTFHVTQGVIQAALAFQHPALAH